MDAVSLRALADRLEQENAALRARLAHYEDQQTIPAPPPTDDVGGEDGQ